MLHVCPQTELCSWAAPSVTAAGSCMTAQHCQAQLLTKHVPRVRIGSYCLQAAFQAMDEVSLHVAICCLRLPLR